MTSPYRPETPKYLERVAQEIVYQEGVSDFGDLSDILDESFWQIYNGRSKLVDAIRKLEAVLKKQEMVDVYSTAAKSKFQTIEEYDKWADEIHEQQRPVAKLQEELETLKRTNDRIFRVENSIKSASHMVRKHGTSLKG